MKRMLMTVVFLLVLHRFTEAASQEQSSIQEWQGEWGEWTFDGRGHNYGASLSVFDCDSATMTCRFRYKSESAESRCSNSRQDGSPLRITGSIGKAQFLGFDYMGEPADCSLAFEKVEADGKRGLRLLNRSGEKCAVYCTSEKPNFPEIYPFKSAVLYPELSTSDCFADSRESRKLWCTDQQIQKLDASLTPIQSRINTLLHTNEYRKIAALRQDILARCSQAAEVRECLLSSFTKAVADMQLSEKNAQDDYDREEKALLTPGDPVEGFNLIGRLEGAYKKRFENVMADGKKYTSENVLEILRVSRDTVYFRTDLKFYNGASCGLSGLARYSVKGALVFDDPLPPQLSFANDAHCRLQLEESSNEVKLQDPGGPCARSHCGIRGGFNGAAFSVSSRRSITQTRMQLLKNSTGYKKALKELKR